MHGGPLVCWAFSPDVRSCAVYGADTAKAVHPPLCSSIFIVSYVTLSKLKFSFRSSGYTRTTNCVLFSYFLIYIAYINNSFFLDKLDENIHVWDSLVIRTSKNDRVPSGRPRITYMFPELYASDDCISPVVRADVQLCQSNCTFRPAEPCNTDNILMVESQLHLPADACQAVDLYLHLRNEIRSAL